MTPTNELCPRTVRVGAVLVAIAAGLYIALQIYDPLLRPILDVLPPFAVAFIFAFLLDPVVDWFQRRGLSRGVGVAIVGLSFLIVFLVVGFLLAPKIADQASGLAANFERYWQNARDQINSLLGKAEPVLRRFYLPTTLGEWSVRFSNQTEEAAGRALSVVASAFASAVSRILWIIIIPLSTLWLLRDLDMIKAKMVHITPARHRESLLKVSSEVGRVFGKYVRGMVAVAILYSVVTSSWLSAAGLDFALVIGGISGFVYLVPYVGTLTIAAVTGIAALVDPGHSLTYAAVLMAAIAVQSFVVFDLAVTPRVLGGSVGVHPVLALFALALGARIYGVVGMVAAVPVAASLQVFVGHLYPRICDNPPQADTADDTY